MGNTVSSPQSSFSHPIHHSSLFVEEYLDLMHLDVSGWDRREASMIGSDLAGR